MTKACVIGWPISHSRSPLIHGYWIAKLGLHGTYTRIPVEPERLQDFILALPENGYAGCNVTIPHKENACHIVAGTDEAARKLGAVNTIYIENGKLLGTNTDGEGFLNNLAANAPAFSPEGRRAVILGAGGAAAAVAHALVTKRMGEVVIVNRNLERAEALCARLGPTLKLAAWANRSDALTDCDILINTTSLGMTGQPPLEIALDRLNPEAVAADIVYTPLRTPLLVAAAARGHTVVEGLGMLLHQAVRGFELWFGTRPKVTQELHDLVARDIDTGYKR